MELKLCQSSLPLPFKPSSFKPNSIYKHLTLLPKRCKYQIQELFSKGQHLNISKQFLIHVVKDRDEPLTSISKLYGVPIYEIAAANKEIIDVGLVFEGQHVNIPSYVTPRSQTNQREKIRFPKIDVSETNRRFKLRGEDVNHKMLYVLSCRHLPYASGSMRWKSALRDLSDPDASYSDSRPEIDNVTDDREHLQPEELSRAYAKLDNDYQKFLSECGMSKWGYWRGGSSE
ncbi:uncharacterized protein LOC132606234 isoform X3 [Lycium barbarum]|uniref:uncharacterized protein LOC132606234 isoform X3 n=1 Tax=Lycium barbarum TaxID=112863 RepID=UPI00293E5256|nr:uncharacterized protein LOC132606234 isoform X3 [Lycium barbarum]